VALGHRCCYAARGTGHDRDFTALVGHLSLLALVEQIHIGAAADRLQARSEASYLMIFGQRNHHLAAALLAVTGGIAMQTFLGMILGAVLLVAGVYVYDSMSTSTVANSNGQVSQSGRTIVNWDVASNDWNTVKTRAHEDWIRLSSK
jgi:hypothetical protein